MNRIETAPLDCDPLFSADRGGRLLDVSAGACQLLGYGRSELVGMRVWDIDPDFSRERWERHWQELCRAGHLRFLSRHRRRDGSVVAVEISAHRLAIEGHEYSCALAQPLTAERLTETALRQSQERLSLALDVSGQALFEMDLRTGGVVFGEAQARMLKRGLDERSATRENWRDWLHPDDREMVLGLYHELVAGQRSEYEADFRFISGAGDWVWLRSVGRVVEWDQEGRPLRMLGTHLDITERKQAEEALRLTQTAVDRAVVGIYWFDVDGRLVYVNDEPCRSLGYGRDELIGASTETFDPAFTAERYAQLWRELKTSGYARFETQPCRKDGVAITVEVDCNYIAVAGKEYNVAFARDISDRKRAEEALRLTQIAVDQAVIGVFWFDGEGKLFYVNDEACRSLGYARDELIGARTERFDPDFTAATYADLWEALKTSGSASFETRHRRKDGTIFPVGVWCKYIAVGGREYNVAFVRDISAAKAAEARLRYHLSSEKTLADISALMIKPGWDDLDARLDWMLERIGAFVDVARSFLLEIGPDRRTTYRAHEWCGDGVAPASRGLEDLPIADDPDAYQRLERGEVAMAQVSRSAATESSDRLRDDPESYPSICIPLLWGGHLRGLLGLEARAPSRVWSEEEIRLLRLVAEIVAHTLQRRESDLALREQTDLLESIDRVSRILARRDPDVDVLEELVGAVLDIFGVDRAFFLAPCDPDAAVATIAMEASREGHPGAFAAGEQVPVTAELKALLRSVLERDAPVASDFEDLSPAAREHGICTQMAVALHPKAGEPWLLGIAQCARRRLWTAAEQRLLKGIAERIEEALNGRLLLERLRDSEARYRAVFDNALDAIIVHDLQGGVLAVNQAMLDMFRLEQAEALCCTVPDLSGPEHPKTGPVEFWARTLAGEDMRFEWTAKQPTTGILFPVEVTLRAIRFGGEQAILANVRDIGERKRAEEALRESEERFATAFRRSPAPTTIADLETARFIDVNDRWLDATGYTRQEAIGRTPTELGHVADRDLLDRALEEMGRRGAVFDYPLPVARKNGERRDYLFSAEKIRLRDKEVLLASVQDVTERNRAEAALRQSEERFATVFHSSPAPMIITEIETGEFLDLNESALAMLDYGRDEVVGRTSTEVGIWAQPGARERLIDRLRAEGAFREEPLRFKTKSGDVVDVLWSGGIIRLGERDVLLTSGFDITERKRAEEALRQSEERFAKAFQSSPVAMLVSAIADGRVIDVNERWLKMLGFRREDMIGRTTKQIGIWVDPSDRDRMIAQLRETGPFQDEPIIIRATSGERLEILWSTEIIEQGQESLLLSSVYDLTPQKRAERALKESEARLRAAVESIPFDFYVLDAERRFVLQNTVSKTRVGDLTGRHASELPANQELVAHFEDMLERALAGTLVTEENWLRLGEEERHFDNIIAPVKDEGGVRGAVGISMDITERRRVEAELRQYREHLEELVQERTDALQHAMSQLVQAEKLAALGNLVAGVAHELNTPLGNARMVSSTLGEQIRELAKALDVGALRRSQLNDFLERGREAVDLLERNTIRAADLIGHFKEVAVDQTSVRRRHFNLRETVEEVLATMRPTLKRTAHRIELDIPPDLELDSYPGPLEQVIANLIGNSLIHGFDGVERGRILIQAQARDGATIQLSYRDDGVGIPAEEQDRIFEPFFTTRLGQGGSGLGLYIVYNLVTGVLGGEVRVESRVGEGVIFSIRLPKAAPDKSGADHADGCAAQGTRIESGDRST